jgi:alpha-glucosidase
VLTYARVGGGGETVIVSLNMSPQPQKLALGLAQAGLRGSQLRTLLSSPRTVTDGSASDPPSLAPYAAWVAEVR